MKNNDGRQEYGIFLENAQLRASANESKNMLRGIGDTAVAESSRIDSAYKKVAGAAVALFSAAAIKQFGMELINITGQFQTFEAVLTNTLQSPAKAKQSMMMLQEFAATTPFQVDALTGAFVKLANQGFVPTYAQMVKLGDLASSTGKGFDQLAEAIIDAQTGEFERLKEFGIRASKDGNQVTFTFKEQQTQVDFTASSIRDYVLSLGELKGVQGANAQIAKTLTGQVSNLQDGITQMMNEIGQSSEGVLSGAISGTAYLVEHYEELGQVLMGLIATYGVYKASVMTVSAVNSVKESSFAAVEIAELQKLLPVKAQAANADIAEAVAKGYLSQATAAQLIAIRAEVQAELDSLRVKEKALIAKVADATKEDALALKQALNAERKERFARQELSQAMQSGNAQKIRRAEIKLTLAEEELNIALKNKEVTANALVSTSSKAKSAATAVDTIQTNLNTVSVRSATTAKTLWTAATMGLTKAFHSLKLAFASHPIGMILTGVTMAISLFSMFKDKTEEAEKALREEHERKLARNNDYLASMSKEQAEVDILFGRLEALTAGTKAYNDTKNDIISKYGQYLKGLGNEIESLQNIEGAYKAISTAAVQAARNRAISDVTSASAGEYAKVEADNLRSIRDLLTETKGVFDGEKIFTSLKESLRTGTEFSDEVKSAIGYTAEWGRETTVVYDTVIPRMKGLFEYLIFGIKDSKAKMNDEIQEIEDVLGGVFSGEGGTTSATMYGTDYKAAQEEWNTAKKELAKIEKDKDAFTREQYNNAVKRKADAKTSFETVGGNTSGKDIGGGSSKPKDYTDQLAKYAQERAQLEIDFEHTVRQAEINAMDEGLDKVLAKNDLNYKKEIEQIKRQKEDKLTKIQEWDRTIWESKNPNWEKDGKKFKPQTTELSVDENTQFETMGKSAFATLTVENKKSYKAVLNDYEKFAVSYIDKANEFENNLKNLDARHKHERLNLLNSGASKEAIDQFDLKAKQEIDAVTAVQKELLAGLDEQMEIKSQTFILFAEQIADMGIQELKLKLDEAELLFAEAKIASGSGGNKSSAIEYQAQIRVLKQQIIALTKKSDKKEDAASGDALTKYKASLKTVNELGNAAKDIAGAFEGLDGDVYSVLDSIGTMSSSVGSMLSAIVLISTTSQATIASTTVAASTGVIAISNVASTAIQGVEKASVILAIIGAAIQIITAIAKAISGVFNNDKKKEKEIKRLQEQVDVLEKSYHKLDDAISKAYSHDAANLIEDQNEMLEQQKILIQNQIAEENSKKKTDNEKIKQYQDKLDEINKQLEENKEKKLDAIFGEDLKSAIDNFAKAYADAWASGEDKAKSAKDTVRQMMRQMVTESIKAAIESSGAMEKIRKKLEEFYNGEVLSGWEQNYIYGMAENLQRELDQQFGWADTLMKDEKPDEARGASSKGLTSMSQDSADELNGRFTAIQGHTYGILGILNSTMNEKTDPEKSMMFNLSTSQQQMLELQRKNLPLLQHLTQLSHLSTISENTAYCRRLEGIEQSMSSMKNDINTIVLKGITIKK